MNRRSVARLVGLTIGLVGLWYVVQLLQSSRDDLGRLLGQLPPSAVATALVLGLLGMTVIGLAWNLLLSLLDRPMPTAAALRAYFVGQLGKYVPGGVWAIVGRGEWARRHGVSAAASYSATILSIGTAYLAACVLVAVLLPFADDAVRTVTAWLVAGLGVVGLLAVHPAVIRLALGTVRRVTGRQLAITTPGYTRSLSIIGLQLITWLAIGTATQLLARPLGLETDWVTMVAATSVSWVVGFLVLPVPGGIGVREGVFVALLGGTPESAAVALASRLVAVVVDLAGAGLSSLAATAAAPTHPPTDTPAEAAPGAGHDAEDHT